MSRIVTGLCGLPSFGTVGSPLIIDGSSGIGALSSYTGDIDAGGGPTTRATLAPGTTPSVNTGGTAADHAARQQALGFAFNVLGTVLFDGFTALTGLPRLSARTTGHKMSISFWLSPDTASYGSILCSPMYSHNEALVARYGAAPLTWDYFDYFSVSPLIGEGNAASLTLYPNPVPLHFNSSSYPLGQTDTAGGTAGGLGNEGGRLIGNSNGNWDYGNGAMISGAAFFDNGGVYTRASTGKYYHVMIGLDTPGDGHIYFTAAVNNTVVVSHVSIGDFHTENAAGTMPLNWPGMKDNAPQLDDAGGYQEPNVWAIGGNFIDAAAEINAGPNYSTLPTGDGMQGAVTELWIKEGVYLDWTNSTIRNKFHTTDLSGNVFLPVDLGKNGATPTGQKPTIYCTGLPDKFVINRATGQKLGVWGSLTMDFRYPGAL